MSKTLLIDGNSIVYRAYFGSAYAKAGILTNSQGFPVNAILTFNRMLIKIIDEVQPTHIFVAFDAGKKTNRHDKLESYKAGRAKTPEQLIQQFPVIKEMLDLLKIKHYEIPGIEADDIIGTLAKLHESKAETFIFSSDRDLLQLVSERIKIIYPQNGENQNRYVDLDNFKEFVNCTPQQIPDYKGLVGDSSDNLPGVQGIGEKGATKMLADFPSLENIYDNIDSFSTKIQEKLLTSKEIAFLCKELATLNLDVEIPFEFDDLFYSSNYDPAIIEFFEKFEIPSLVRFYQERISQNKENDFSNIIF